MRYLRMVPVLVLIAITLFGGQRFLQAQESLPCEEPTPLPQSLWEQTIWAQKIRQLKKIAELRKNVQNIVVIYAENRSFDHLYGFFPGADGICQALKNPNCYQQKDRDGVIFSDLPPIPNDK